MYVYASLLRACSAAYLCTLCHTIMWYHQGDSSAHFMRRYWREMRTMCWDYLPFLTPVWKWSFVQETYTDILRFLAEISRKVMCCYIQDQSYGFFRKWMYSFASLKNMPDKGFVEHFQWYRSLSDSQGNQNACDSLYGSLTHEVIDETRQPTHLRNTFREMTRKTNGEKIRERYLYQPS